MKLVMVETMHHDCMKQMLYMEVRDPRVPSSYDKGHPYSNVEHSYLLLHPTYRIRSHLQIPTYHYLTRSSLKLPILTLKSEALKTR